MRRRSDVLVFTLVALLATYAAWRAISRAWTCDDAFISYRYAENLVSGHGLVFNPGERVEGYSNFLFTIAIAGALSVRIDPRVASMALGLLFYFVVAGVLVVWSFRRRTRHGRWVPLGAALWLVQDDLHTWATGGLETTMFAAFAVTGLALLVVPKDTDRRRGHLVIAGVILALTCTVRPDGVLFALVGLAVPLVMRDRSRPGPAPWRELVAIGLPMLAIGGAYVAFKLGYYGRLLPTTFYAKSASEGRWEQGLVYIGLYFAKNWSTALAIVGLPITVLVARRWRRAGIRRDAWIALAAFIVFAIYVARSAGDYMFARRLVPALPFLFVFLDAALDVAGRRFATPIATLVLAGAVLPYAVLPDERGARVAGVGEERLFYPDSVIAARRAQAAIAKEVFAAHRMRAAFGGGMCMFAYYSGLPDMVEPNGLTQYWIAEEGEDLLGRTGHKGVSLDVLRAHGVALVFHNDPPPIAPSERFDEMVVAGVLRVQILTYDEALMSALARDPRVRFKPIGVLLDEAEADVKQMPCSDARATHEALRPFYLAAHPDADARIARAVASVCTAR